MTEPRETAQAVRREIYYSGAVQGVGFRYTTRAIAQRFPVTGLVENLADGRVHLVVEGVPSAVEGFLAAVESEMAANIESREVANLPASGEFGGFNVKR